MFRLYGETASWPTPDLLHIESIPERSRLHDWNIRPHRHADLVQLLYVSAGQAELDIDGGQREIAEPCIQVVPALCVHGFRFSHDIQGYVVSLALPLVDSLEQALGTRVLPLPWCRRLAADEQLWLDNFFDSLRREYASRERGRDVMLSALVQTLLVWVQRRQYAELGEELNQDRGQQLLGAFMQLLEQYYCEHWPIEHYATNLGVSAPHLNALCRRLCHQSALQVIHQRLLLEAKRCLVYTTMTVGQIANSLGFSEPAYFSRFFKRHTGISPRTFRGRESALGVLRG
ncbi:MAG: helix-turn-helix domain-containing protein [Haliea sp.]